VFVPSFPFTGKVPDKGCNRVIPALLDKLDVKPSILHGDLWVRTFLYFARITIS
jgi:fructosamine-3-kinase